MNKNLRRGGDLVLRDQARASYSSLCVTVSSRYVGNPKPTQVGQEYGRKRDGLEKKPRSTLPVGLRFK